jgi:hypothetical protein
LSGEIKRRTDVVAIFPNERAIVRLLGALFLEQNDERAVQRRYMTLETLDALSDDATRKPRKKAWWLDNRPSTLASDESLTPADAMMRSMTALERSH